MQKLYQQDERYIDRFKNTSCFTNLTSRILSAARGGIYYGPSEGQYTGSWQYEPHSKCTCIYKRMCDSIRDDLYLATTKACILMFDHATEWYKQQLRNRVLRNIMKSMTLKELIEYKCRDYGNLICESPPSLAVCLDSKTLLLRSKSSRLSHRIADPIKRILPEFNQQDAMAALRKTMKSMTLKELIEYKCRDYGNCIYESPSPAKCLASKTPLRSEPSCASLRMAEDIKRISNEFNKKQMPMTALKKAMNSMTLKELIEYKCRGYGDVICESPPAESLNSKTSKTPLRSVSPCDVFQVAEYIKRSSAEFQQRMQMSALRKAMKSMTLQELIEYKCRGYEKIICETLPAKCLLDSETREIKSGRSSNSFILAGTIKRISPEFLELLREHDRRLKKMGLDKNATDQPAQIGDKMINDVHM